MQIHQGSLLALIFLRLGPERKEYVLLNWNSRLHESFHSPKDTPWNNLPEEVVLAPNVNSFKSRMNNHMMNHPVKFSPRCYVPGTGSEDNYYQMGRRGNTS